MSAQRIEGLLAMVDSLTKANDALRAERDALLAERDAANRLLRDVRESVRHREGSTCDVPWPLVAKIDAHLTPSVQGAT